MKILKIELQNIHSLKCEHPIQIDFEKETFSEVGLFAITGATGAGKTTLLDAITIALYRRVARFEKSGSKAGLIDVVSYGSQNAFTRVTFESQDHRYEALWAIRLTNERGRKLLKPVETLRLKNLSTDEIIAESKTACDEKIVEITQLNFDQFLRSVLLAQGEFAAFLSAKNSEKGMLLQQIAGDDIYRRIGETLKDRISTEKKILDSLKSQLNQQDLLSHESLQQLKEEENTLIRSLEKLKDDLQLVEKCVRVYEQLEKLETTRKEIENGRKQLQEQLNLHAACFRQLEKHEAAEPFKPALTEIERLEMEMARKTTEIAAKQHLLPGLETQWMEADKTVTRCQTQQTAATENQTQWILPLEKVVELDATLVALKLQLSESLKTRDEISALQKGYAQSLALKEKEQQIRIENRAKLQLYLAQHPHLPEWNAALSQWTEQLTQRKNNHDRLSTLKAEIAATKAEADKLTQQIETDNPYFERGLSEMTQLKTELDLLQQQQQAQPIGLLWTQQQALTVQKEHLQKLNEWADRHLALSSEQKQLADKQQWLETQRQDLTQNLHAQQAAVQQASLSLSDAEALYAKDQYIVSLEDARQKLHAGEACPLCGSEHHPLIAQYAGIEVSASKKRLDERKHTLETLTAGVQELSVLLANTESQKQLQAEQATLNNQHIVEIHTKFQQAGSNYPITEKAQLAAALQQVDDERTAVGILLAQAQENQKLKDQKEAALKLLDTQQKELELRLTALHTMQAGLARTQTNRTQEVATLHETQSALERALTRSLTERALELPAPEFTSDFLTKIGQAIREYTDTQTQYTEVGHQLNQLEIELLNLQKLITDKNRDYAELNKTIRTQEDSCRTTETQRQAILPPAISTTEKRADLQAQIDRAQKELDSATTLRQQLREQISQQQTECHTLQQQLAEQGSIHRVSLVQLNAQLTQSCFENREQLTLALLPESTKAEYLQLRKKTEDTQTSLDTLQRHTDAERLLLTAQTEGIESYEKLLQQQQALHTQRDQLQKRQGEITESFRKDTEIKLRNAQVVATILQQETVCLKWNKLMDILGGSQEAFNTYVQRLTLKNLIDRANLHLYKLNRRYSLRLNPEYKTGEELHFKLVDHYQANEMRLLDTTSGGEKFLISLALALGLSDLASCNVRIGSLFIDEGFGTLDSNTLETVISTLETLKAQGKMIGIISHVDSLKERIPLQIQVLKQSNGVSTIEIGTSR